MSAPRGQLVWDDRFTDYDFGPDHPFTEQSRRSSVRLLETLLPSDVPVEFVREVPVATREYLETFHEAEFVELVHQAAQRWGAPIPLDAGDTPSFPGCFDAAARIAEGAARAVDYALEHRAPSFHPAGGLHHAHPERASGFCIFNDVALAVGRAVAAGHRVAYVDIDAHHGDGVMYGFYSSGRVLDIDFHQDGRTLFPGTGSTDETGLADGNGLKVNLPLPPGAGDEALRPLFQRVVPPLLRSFRPDLIVLQHGADGHVGDPLTALQYTSAAYDEIDRTVLDLATEMCDRRLVVTGGGGYRPECVARVFARAGAALLGVPVPDLTEKLPVAWRASFERDWRHPSPARWGDPALEGTPVWNSDDTETLVRELEGELGIRLPRSDPA
ncbi:MAG TPA: acetoin utilization protein AcuC [Thermoplasmata archaeon]|nr:acetoin utilization protein AcuC [Thermoplasmata archaeon]